MARGDQLGRQWKIIRALIAARQGKSVSDLSETIECHPRTVYRDLEALQTAGFPLYTEKTGGKKVWSLMDTVKHQMPIPLSLTELMALYFSRNMMRVLENTVFFDSLESFFKKIKTMLPPEYIRYLEQLEDSVAVGQAPYKPYGRYREVISTVNEAVLERRYVDMTYYAMGRRKKTRRRVAPYRLWFVDGTLYLVGYCQLRKDIRVFVIDRIRTLRLTGEHFEIPDNFNFNAFTRSRFGVFSGRPVHIRIWFSVDIAGYIKEKIWHPSQKIDALKDGSVVLELDVAGTRDIKAWILNWGSKAIVLEPAALRAEIRAEAETMAGQYASGSGTPPTNQNERTRFEN